MHLKTESREYYDVTWEIIESEINKLNGFLILTDKESSYVQCAGGHERLIIEFRKVFGQEFKHFVIGRKGFFNPIKVNWVALATTVGNIRVHKREILNLNDAKKVFNEFYFKGKAPSNMNKRNVTKLHKS